MSVEGNKRPFHLLRKFWGIFAVIAIAFGLSGCGESSDQTDKPETSVETGGEKTGEGKDAKAEKEVEEEETVEIPYIEPHALSGSGDTVTDAIDLQPGFIVLDANHSGSRNFIVKLYDPNGNPTELMINHIGNYNGKTFALIEQTGSYRFEITADGNWDLIVDQNIPEDPETGPVSGKGDDVRFIKLEPGSYVVNGSHDGERNFIVKVNGKNLLFNEIGSYEGSKIQGVKDSGIYAVSVKADGNWTIEFTE